jgi:16S rRNA (adenine1518-N6/adenine1519-N6)-dimethyltransferase
VRDAPSDAPGPPVGPGPPAGPAPEPAAGPGPAAAPAPVQPSLRRMREFAIRPDRDLGQNFLIDSNMLGVIERAAALSSEDVVLEVGGGLGVLSEHLAERVAHVHVVELDEHLREALLDATVPHANVTVHWGDALQLDLAAFAPSPTKLVANLPYNIAAGLILRTIAVYPAMTRWVAMVQREVGERFAAKPGTPAYGVPSVLAQLACEVRVLRSVSRSVFYPVPNVDSVLLALERHEGEGATPELRELVRHSFAHRRKALAGSLALAPDAPAGTRERVRAALVELGRPADVRAERLAPEDFRALAKALAP